MKLLANNLLHLKCNVSFLSILKYINICHAPNIIVGIVKYIKLFMNIYNVSFRVADQTKKS